MIGQENLTGGRPAQQEHVLDQRNKNIFYSEDDHEEDNDNETTRDFCRIDISLGQFRSLL